MKTGDPIILLQSRQLWSEVWIDETQLGHVQAGRYVTIKLRSNPDSQIRGRIAGVLPTTDHESSLPKPTDNPILQTSSKIRLKVEHVQDPNGLVPGLTGMMVVKRNQPQLIVDRIPESLRLCFYYDDQ